MTGPLPRHPLQRARDRAVDQRDLALLAALAWSLFVLVGLRILPALAS